MGKNSKKNRKAREELELHQAFHKIKAKEAGEPFGPVNTAPWGKDVKAAVEGADDDYSQLGRHVAVASGESGGGKTEAQSHGRPSGRMGYRIQPYRYMPS